MEDSCNSAVPQYLNHLANYGSEVQNVVQPNEDLAGVKVKASGQTG